MGLKIDFSIFLTYTLLDRTKYTQILKNQCLNWSGRTAGLDGTVPLKSPIKKKVLFIGMKMGPNVPSNPTLRTPSGSKNTSRQNLKNRKEIRLRTSLLRRIYFLLERALRALASSSGGAACPGGWGCVDEGSIFVTHTGHRTDGHTDVIVEIVM